MIIDFHTHIFPNKIAKNAVENLAKQANVIPYSNGTVEGLVENMQNGGVDIAVVLPVLTSPKQFDSVLRFAKEINENYSNTEKKIISFAGIHPNCENVCEKIKLIKEQGFLGIKIHPDYQNTFIDDEKYISIILLAKENDLIVVTHAGVDDGFPNEPVKCPPERALKVIEKVNYNKLVFAHYGGSKMWVDVEKYLCDKDVYFDTGFTFNNITKEQFLNILLKHGEDRVLFATDLPWQDMKYSVDKLKSFNLPQKVLDKILYKNALKLLKME